MPDIRDRIRGSLIGGAAGDALGYAVEFDSEQRIFARYGRGGIRAYELKNGKALISDDTQMTLFAAYAMILWAGKDRDEKAPVHLRHCAAGTCLDWLLTQETDYASACRKYDGFKEPGLPTGLFALPLLRLPELYSRRAPGNTCLSALRTRRVQKEQPDSYIDDPLNHSKGCGGVMRAAPFGMLPWQDTGEMDRESAEAAAVTHGHSLGYLPAAVLSHIVFLLIYGEEEKTLQEIVEEARDRVAEVFAEDESIGDLVCLIDRAIDLSGNDRTDLENIHSLGEGWVGDEALAIAIYCSLRYREDFSGGLIASVNHKGDSDSTGAVAGNILGALVGYEAMEAKWKEDLELSAEIIETADLLFEAACRRRTK